MGKAIVNIWGKPFLSQPLDLLLPYFANYIQLLGEALMRWKYGNFTIIVLV